MAVSPFPIGSQVLAYARVSTRSQGTGPSLETQLQVIRQKASDLELDIIDEITYQGTAFNRNNLEQLEKRMEVLDDSCQIRGVLVYSADRFCRRVNWAEDFMQEYPNIILYSVMDEVSSNTANGRHQLRTAISSAQWESDLLSGKIKRLVAQRRRLGRYVNGAPPFGFSRKRRSDGTFVQENVDSEQRVLNMIRYLKDRRNYPLSPDDFCTACKSVGIEMASTGPAKDEIMVLDYSDDGVDDGVDDDRLVVETDIDLPLTHDLIAEFLNLHGLTKRGRKWTRSMVAGVC